MTLKEKYMDDLHLVIKNTIDSFILRYDYFKYSKLKKYIIDDSNIKIVPDNYSIIKHLENQEELGRIELKYTEDDIKVIVLNFNYIRKEKLNKLKNILKNEN